MKHAIIDITSPGNKSFKEWKSLLTGKGIKKHEKALISGRKIVADVLEHHAGIAAGYILSDAMTMEKEETPSDIPIYRMKQDHFKELDVFGTRTPLLVVNIPMMGRGIEDCAGEGPALLIPFQDPSNVGAVIRTAAAFGMRTIVLLEEAATPFHPKSIRAAGEQVFNVELVRGPSVSRLDRFPMPVVALHKVGTSIVDFRFPERFALLPGLEGPGLPPDLKADYTVSIPMEPEVESLNAAVAVSIALYEWKRRIISKKQPCG